jgi:Leu/Phe-tRNA-protein transferase
MKKKPKTYIPDDTLTWLSIADMADQCRAMLESRTTCWMPAKVRKVYERMIKDSHALQVEAYKLANIQHEDEV